MGWLYMSSIRPHKTPKEYLDNQFSDSETHTRRILKSAVVGMRTYYGALEVVERSTGERLVTAIVCLIKYRPSGFSDGMVFGYKDMDEGMGPCESDCPASILDLLTPTDSEWANQWRARCRARLVKKLPTDGDVIRFAEPKFTNGKTLDTFRVFKRGRALRFICEGMSYSIGNLKDREYTIPTRRSGARCRMCR